jgi:proteasome lid subunit RPN8/RPN11
VRIARHLTDAMVRHALDDRPDECCGLIGGKGDRAETVYRASNAEASPFRYSIAPSEQLELLNRIDDAGEELLAIYHSHTRTEAFPSQTDVNLASGWPDATWVIISLKDPERPEIRAFRIIGERIEDVDLEIS